MKLKLIEVDKIPKDAVRIHMYNARDMLRPRGSMEKESLGAYVKDKLTVAFETWTNQSYGDSLDPALALCVLHQNMMEEVNEAFGEFANEVGKYDPEALKKFIEALPDDSHHSVF